MTMQPGMPPLPAFGAAVERDLGLDAVTEYADDDRTERDRQDGEPVGRSDLEDDTTGTTGRSAVDESAEQSIDEDALASYLDRDRTAE